MRTSVKEERLELKTFRLNFNIINLDYYFPIRSINIYFPMFNEILLLSSVV